jgi:hypothetical protein
MKLPLKHNGTPSAPACVLGAAAALLVGELLSKLVFDQWLLTPGALALAVYGFYRFYRRRRDAR